MISNNRTATEPMPEHISQNIDEIVAFHRREERKVGDSQRRLETLGGIIGRPSFLAALLSFVGLWVLVNTISTLLGLEPRDEPPFFWLQGIVSVGAMLTATIVLITQNREAKLDGQRSELELQVTLSTEQKATKIIHLLEELRRDLPMVKDRHDPQAAAMQKPTNPKELLAALDERRDKA